MKLTESLCVSQIVNGTLIPVKSVRLPSRKKKLSQTGLAASKLIRRPGSDRGERWMHLADRTDIVSMGSEDIWRDRPHICNPS